jgi:hypothetical protein
MNMKGKARALSEEEIDKIVIVQADDDSAWEKPIHVRKKKQTSLSLPSELAARAAFFARLHRESNVESWLRRIIQERIDMEEAAFTGLKRDLSPKNSV